MKQFIALALFLFVLVPATNGQAVVDSEISEVVAFTGQALVTRRAEVSAAKGLNEFNIETEAFWVDPDSVQASVYGRGEINSVQVKEIHLKDAPQEKINILEKKLEKLNEDKALIVKNRGVLLKEDKFLNSLIDFSETQVPEDIKTNFPDPQDLEKALNFLSESYNQINEKELSLAGQLRDLEKEIKLTSDELNALRRPNQKSKRVIEVIFNSLADQKITIEATYLVSGAYWRPIYKVDVPPQLKKISLTMFSKLKQKTGEDWKNIKLAISNVVPLKGAGLPMLDSWYLDAERYQLRKANLSLLRADYESDEMGDKYQEELKSKVFAGAAPLEKEANFAQAMQKELPLSFEYQMPQTLTIASQDKETTLPLFSKNLEAEFFHYSVPKVSPLVFLTGRITPDKELLAGPLNVYFSGRFVGKTALSAKKAGEHFDINLGADREVVIKREKLKDELQETFFQKIQRQTVVRNLAFKITAENRKDKPVTLKLIDAIPVSKTDRIEVRDLKVSPRATQEDYLDKKGLNLWEFNLRPGETKIINIEFVITYPKDTPVYGL